MSGMLDVGAYRVEGDEELALAEFPSAEVVSHQSDRNRSRTVDRYRADGRPLWAALGAWPWAVNAPPASWHTRGGSPPSTRRRYATGPKGAFPSPAGNGVATHHP